MIKGRLALFTRALARAPKTIKASERKLYTDSIYPYPFNYVNNVKYPSQCVYRENYPGFEWEAEGVITGHYTFPDPSAWTDEELGIPPEDAGSYREWVGSKKD